MQQTVTTNPLILGSAFRDVLNTYTREVLLGNQLITEDQFELLNSDQIAREVNLIIQHFVEVWKSCIVDDEILA